MALNLQTLPVNETLANLNALLTQQEAGGYELITFAKTMVGGSAANLATFRNRATAPAALTLVAIPGTQSVPTQQSSLSVNEAGGSTLISYATVIVQNKDINVAAYRATGT